MSIHELPPKPEPTPLNKIDLSILADIVSEYNAQHGMGNKLAGIFIAQYGGAEEAEQTRPRISLVSAQERAEPILRTTGIGLEEIRGATTIFSTQGETPTSELRINLVNGNQFVAYLNVLDSDSLTESQERGLITVAEILTAQLRSQYRLCDPQDTRLLELFGSAKEIIGNYQRLGGAKPKLSEAVDKLNKLVELAKKGQLREYLASFYAGILPGPEIQFRAGDWHKDSSVSEYIKRWSKGMQVLREVSSNPRAEEIFLSIAAYLRQSIETARSFMIKNPDYYREGAADFLAVLDANQNTLEEIAEEHRVG